MSFTNSQKKTISQEATALGVEPAALLAFCIVEANAQVYANVEGKEVPLIRYEGHVYARTVPAKLRDEAFRLGLASTKVGGVPNPTTQTGRYQLLARAKKLDYGAAVQACSWGFGQVMGENYQMLGFSSPKALEAKAMSGFEGQLELMTRFIQRSGIIPHLKRKDWSAVARIYNGSGYAKNKYDIKMRQAYEAQVGKAPVPSSANMLRAGSKGQDVRELQTLLRRAGVFSGVVDGDFGPSTEKAVITFQSSNGLEADGVAGRLTMTALAKYKATEEADLGKMPIGTIPEVSNAAKLFAPTAFILGIRNSLTETAQHLLGVEHEVATSIANGMLAVTSLIGIGLAAYGLYGYLKSKRTTRGIENRT